MSDREGTAYDLGPRDRMRRVEGIAWRMVGGEAVLVNVRQDEVIHLDPVASFIWSKMDGQAVLEDIAGAVVGEFDVDMETALEDTVAFAGRLLEQGAAELVELEE